MSGFPLSATVGTEAAVTTANSGYVRTAFQATTSPFDVTVGFGDIASAGDEVTFRITANLDGALQVVSGCCLWDGAKWVEQARPCPNPITVPLITYLTDASNVTVLSSSSDGYGLKWLACWAVYQPC